MPQLPVSAEPDLSKNVEGGAGIFVIRGGGNCRSWNNIQYKVGLSARNVGSSKLSMNVATIPPGGSGICAHPRGIRADAVYPRGQGPS